MKPPSLSLLLCTAKFACCIPPEDYVTQQTEIQPPDVQATPWNSSYISSPTVRTGHLTPRTTPVRPVWLIFTYQPGNPLDIAIHLGQGTVPGAVLRTRISLRRQHYHGQIGNSGAVFAQSLCTMYLEQRDAVFPLIEVLPNGIESIIVPPIVGVTPLATMAMRFQVGETELSDFDILDPGTGYGALYAAAKLRPLLSPTSGLSEVYRQLLAQLDVKSNGFLTPAHRSTINFLFRVFDDHDLLAVSRGGTAVNLVFPPYRIPFIETVRVGPHGGVQVLAERAYVVLDNGQWGAGRVWSINLATERARLYSFIRTYLAHPNWNGIDPV